MNIEMYLFKGIIHASMDSYPEAIKSFNDPFTHIVTNKEITDFEKITRTDIEEIIIDIVNGKIFSPFILSKGKK